MKTRSLSMCRCPGDRRHGCGCSGFVGQRPAVIIKSRCTRNWYEDCSNDEGDEGDDELYDHGMKQTALRIRW